MLTGNLKAKALLLPLIKKVLARENSANVQMNRQPLSYAVV